MICSIPDGNSLDENNGKMQVQKISIRYAKRINVTHNVGEKTTAKTPTSALDVHNFFNETQRVVISNANCVRHNGEEN